MDGIYFEGEFKKGIPNGKGKKRWKNGSKYEGNFEEGKENGKGKKKLRMGNAMKETLLME